MRRKGSGFAIDVLLYIAIGIAITAIIFSIVYRSNNTWYHQLTCSPPAFMCTTQLCTADKNLEVANNWFGCSGAGEHCCRITTYTSQRGSAGSNTPRPVVPQVITLQPKTPKVTYPDSIKSFPEGGKIMYAMGGDAYHKGSYAYKVSVAVPACDTCTWTVNETIAIQNGKQLHMREYEATQNGCKPKTTSAGIACTVARTAEKEYTITITHASLPDEVWKEAMIGQRLRQTVNVVGQKAKTSTETCDDLKGTCQNVATSCSGYYEQGKCPGANDNQCCISYAAASTKDSCQREGGDWCEKTDDKTKGYCSAGQCTAPGYQSTFVGPLQNKLSGKTDTKIEYIFKSGTSYERSSIIVATPVTYSGLSVAWKNKNTIGVACDKTYGCTDVAYKFVDASSQKCDELKQADVAPLKPRVIDPLQCTTTATKETLPTTGGTPQQESISSGVCYKTGSTTGFFKAENFDTATSQGFFTLEDASLSDKSLCVYGIAGEKGKEQIYVAGPPRKIFIDAKPPEAKIIWDPWLVTLTFSCADPTPGAGCEDQYGIAYINNITAYFQALGRGSNADAVRFCPDYKNDGLYAPTNLQTVQYQQNAVQVLCMRTKDKAGNANIAIKTVYNAYATAAGIIAMAVQP